MKKCYSFNTKIGVGLARSGSGLKWTGLIEVQIL